MTSYDNEFEYDEAVFQNEKILCIDASNLLYRSFYANRNIEEEHLDGLVHYQFLLTLNKYYKKLKPTKVILCFDKRNWRKEYTLSDKCISKKVYKGNRRQNMTQKQKELFELFMNCIQEFEEIIRVHTGIIVLSEELLEADDLMAGVAQKYSDSNKITIVTADKDMLQLLQYPNVEIISPASGKPMTLSEWDNDWEWFLFVKMFRGDTGDNVEKALPGVRKTRLKKAYEDDYELVQLLNETWERLSDDGEENVTFKVYDLYLENELLMNLSKQPEEIQELIHNTINESVSNPGAFSLFHFLKFCGKHNLKKLSERIQDYVPLLSQK